LTAPRKPPGRRAPPPAVEAAAIEAAMPRHAEHPRAADGFRYALDVLSGRIPACREVRQACRRFGRDLAQANNRGGGARRPWRFRPDLAELPMAFAGMLPNIKGPEAGRPLRLMPWQCFALANLFGWVERGTATRRFRQGVVYVPRGNGKTSLAAPVALYLTFCDDEGGAEGYAAAVTREQARILFDTARAMVLKRPGLKTHPAFGIEASANSIYQQRTFSRFIPISSDAKALDGKNVQVAVLDEIASHKTSEVYDVMRTAMGKRRHPLLLAISTATANLTGIGRQLWDYSKRVLDGKQSDERLFALLYTLDPEDDPWSEASWIKANPSWAQAVQPAAIASIMAQARNNPAQEAAAKTRHLNVWVGADEALFSTRAWAACLDPALSLDALEGEECHIGLDLARRTDLAAMALVFPRTGGDGKARYSVFARCYLNEGAVAAARNPSYPGWAAAGHLTVTPGDETDFGAIEEDLRDLCARFRVASVGTDPWQAAHLSQRLRAEGVPMFDFRTTTQNLSPAINELDAAMRSGRLAHDGNPVLAWCVGNVVGREDRRGNLFPAKSPDSKIDAAVALMMAVGRAQAAAAEPARESVSAFFTDPLFA